MNGNLKNILITGGTGYIGVEVVKKLLSFNCNIALVVRDINKARELFKDEVYYIDSSSFNLFQKGVEKFSPDTVIHLAAYSTSSDKYEDKVKLIESNIIYTMELLSAIETSNVKLFINTGSFSEYYENNEKVVPTYFYSATKTSARVMIDYFAKKNGFKFVNSILYTVYGKKSKNKKIIDYAIESLAAEESIKMSEGTQLLDFVHIDDVVGFYVNVLTNYEYISSNNTYFVGTGKGTTIRELVNYLETITKKKANILWGLNKERKLNTIQATANTVKAYEELKWKSNISLYDGLKEYVRLKNNA